MILRLWDNLLNEGESGITNKLPQPTLIVAFDLKVTTHNGLSLTTGFNPYFMINPPLHQNEPLLAWYNKHIPEIGQLIQTEAYKSTDILLPPPDAADIVSIRVISASMETLKTAWVAATIHLLPAQERLWYTVCDKCKKTVNLPVGWDLPCMYCNKEMNVEPRCNVQVFQNDESGTLSAVLFTGTAEKFIQFTAAELMEADEKKEEVRSSYAAAVRRQVAKPELKPEIATYKGEIAIKFSQELIDQLAIPFKFALVGKFSQGSGAGFLLHILGGSTTAAYTWKHPSSIWRVQTDPIVGSAWAMLLINTAGSVWIETAKDED